MTRKSNLDAAVSAILTTPFSTRRGLTVPTTRTVTLRSGGVHVTAAYLYADMADSSGMARLFRPETAARIIRAYLSSVTRVLKHHGGAIRSFDGDRVLAVYIGDGAAARAAKAALEVKWVVDNVVDPQLTTKLQSYAKGEWTVKSRCGVDFGPAFIVRGGVRDSNDLVSVGDAPNVAAKLSDLKTSRTTITDRLWRQLDQQTRFSGHGPSAKAIWSAAEERSVAGRVIKVRRSNWGWVVQ